MERAVIKNKLNGEIIYVDLPNSKIQDIDRKYRFDKNYEIKYEAKKEFVINGVDNIYLLPSYYKEVEDILYEICKTLHRECKYLIKVGIYDLHLPNNEIQLSANHTNNPDFNAVDITFNLKDYETNIKLFIEKWKEYCK